MPCEKCRCNACLEHYKGDSLEEIQLRTNYNWSQCCRWITASQICRELKASPQFVYKKSRLITPELRKMNVASRKSNGRTLYFIPNLIIHE